MELIPAELRGALVVDSEGYINGSVVKIEIKPEGPIFNIKSTKNVKELVPDTDVLEQVLIKDLKNKFAVSTVQDLYRYVAKELKVESINENDLVNYAKLKKMTIPIKEVSIEVEEEKPYIYMDDIEAVNRSEFGNCIVLKTPIEAKIRGVELQKTPLYQDEESLKEKFVIDNKAKILGKVHSFVMSAKGLGIRVGREGTLTKLVPDIDSLKKTIFTDNIPRDVMREMASLGIEQPRDMTDEKLIAYAKMKGYEIPKRVITIKTELFYRDSVFWRNIKKIGDVILLNGTLAEDFEEESNIEESEPINLNTIITKPEVNQKSRSPSLRNHRFPVSFSFITRPEKLLLGIYVGILLMVFLGLIPYLGALLCGVIAGYMAKGWRSGAMAGLIVGLAGTLILALILRLLLPVGLGDFLSTILPDFILNDIIQIFSYEENVFLFYRILVNALIGTSGGFLLGYFGEIKTA
ncbi:MAG: hypothetical protein L6N95_00635 [Candidatus Methylarchaceae archaeon HK01B]|nr:hypothetical protein [Candidatus Methylarchaceae archaeon HK01B]